MKPIAVLIVTDLDGTLLDHDDYSFAAARPALEVVHALGIPLILNTSKTLAEVQTINQALDNRQPAVVENGGALCFPLDIDYPFELAEAHETIDGHALIRFSPAYAEIREFIGQQRSAHGFRLIGFGDMGVVERARNTGLDLAAAARAGLRLCSEPLVWLDSAAHLEQFRAAAHAVGLTLTRGGRFWHLMGDTSKARGLAAMRSLFSTGQAEVPTVIALGDSDNDREMLRSADIAVVVRRPDGSCLDGCNGIRRTLITEQPGPAGWNEAVLEILNELGLYQA